MADAKGKKNRPPRPDGGSAAKQAEATELRKLFEVWVSSDKKARLVMFFHQNPGVIETLEGLARRLGLSLDALRGEIADHVELGVLKEREIGGRTLISYDRSKESKLEQLIKDLVKKQEDDL